MFWLGFADLDARVTYNSELHRKRFGTDKCSQSLIYWLVLRTVVWYDQGHIHYLRCFEKEIPITIFLVVKLDRSLRASLISLWIKNKTDWKGKSNI